MSLAQFCIRKSGRIKKIRRMTAGISSKLALMVCKSIMDKKRNVTIAKELELVSKELNQFRVIADLFPQIGGHSKIWI